MDQNKAEINIPNKLFFKIGEVSELTEVPPYVLRYWQSEFNLLRPIKNKTGQRVYRRKDVELVTQIKDLLYNEKYTIAGVKKKLCKEKKQSNNSLTKKKSVAVEGIIMTRKEVLKRHKKELQEIMNILQGV
ncbi:MAG: MerR family transcriptional regulator [bacterium]